MINVNYHFLIILSSLTLGNGLPITSWRPSTFNTKIITPKPSRLYLPTGSNRYPGVIPLPFNSLDKNTRPIYEVADEYVKADPENSSVIGTSTKHTTSSINHQQHEPTSIVEDGSSTINREKLTRDILLATAGITSLDWFLTNKGYNTPLHPPVSQLLALLLSQYGRYLPINNINNDTRLPRVYSYMTVNNIHNSRPFGQYKWTRDFHSDFHGNQSL